MDKQEDLKIHQKLDMLMEALVFQQDLLKQVLLQYDQILQRISKEIHKSKSKIITMDKL